MPIHNWSRLDVDIFHDFHQSWTVELAHALNAGLLPQGHYAMIASRPEWNRALSRVQSPEERYAARANQIQVKNRAGSVAGVVEIISPGDKGSQGAIEANVMRLHGQLARGVNLLIADLFPPSSRDRQGIHKLIWERIADEPFELPADKQLTVAAYMAGNSTSAYIEPIAIGDALPEVPIFLASQRYVRVPLESTYLSTWSKCPQAIREIVENQAG